VAKIGVLNTWRIGFLVSLVISSAAIIHANTQRMWRVTLEAYLIAMVVTIVCSLLGFVAGYIDSSGIEILVDSVRNKQQFIQVQTMHNFTYMGSILGMLAALFWHFYRRKIQRY
jgi:ABC-type Na+ efflux pump permease subunit